VVWRLEQHKKQYNVQSARYKKNKKNENENRGITHHHGKEIVISGEAHGA